MAYFDQEVSLSKMVQHIYGNTSVLTALDRGICLSKNWKCISIIWNEIKECLKRLLQAKFNGMHLKNNLTEGIGYYQSLFTPTTDNSMTAS
jgi:hypothetical protein